MNLNKQVFIEVMSNHVLPEFFHTYYNKILPKGIPRTEELVGVLYNTLRRHLPILMSSDIRMSKHNLYIAIDRFDNRKILQISFKGGYGSSMKPHIIHDLNDWMSEVDYNIPGASYKAPLEMLIRDMKNNSYKEQKLI